MSESCFSKNTLRARLLCPLFSPPRALPLIARRRFALDTLLRNDCCTSCCLPAFAFWQFAVMASTFNWQTVTKARSVVRMAINHTSDASQRVLGRVERQDAVRAVTRFTKITACYLRFSPLHHVGLKNNAHFRFFNYIGSQVKANKATRTLRHFRPLFRSKHRFRKCCQL